MRVRWLHRITAAGAKYPSPACRHEGFHSATTRYDRRAGVLCFVLVCEGCSGEVQEVTGVAYRPQFAAHRNPSLAA
jgi:hypothetical protein